MPAPRLLQTGGPKRGAWNDASIHSCSVKVVASPGVAPLAAYETAWVPPPVRGVPSPPKILEPIHCHFSVADRMLDIFMTEVVLQRARVVTIIREFVPAGMPKHVRVDAKRHLGSVAEALDKAVESYGAYRSTTLAHKHVCV